MSRQEVVVITGATAGIGRATARLFARQGAHIGLLARNEERLEATRREVEELGGKAIALPTDVADAQQVEAGAERVEQELGPIDIWVNDAMATVFAPFDDIAPEDYRRVTDVTYHGYVWGTRSALKRMRKRNSGTIVQVGSALAHRGIPLQAPYCGAKHAIKGFTEAVRTELLHEKSDVHITIVGLPAVNTPQFEWGVTTLDKHPRPMAPVYQPEVAAEAVVWATHARKREVMVGVSTRMTATGEKLIPGLLDRLLAKTGVSGQMMKESIFSDRPSNLWEPVPGDYGAHGRFDEEAYRHSPWLWLNMNRTLAVAMAGAGMAALAVIAGHSADRRQ